MTREELIQALEEKGEIYGETFGIMDTAEGLRPIWYPPPEDWEE
jgi:hypothetical protein